MDDEPLNASPIFEFNRPHLYMGGDRELVLLALLVSMIFVVVLQNIYTAIFGVILAIVSVKGLQLMAKADPNMRSIYQRYRKYQSFYPAFSTKLRK
ncbi:conjugal transfer protein TrbD [Photobacterium damselae subsp. piscicida]|uniref:conjugal transfer protein TrbD n=1 Tax=Photobacterium damselae TaxID=38293 RepID=UPI001075DAE6|nr:conjugal transfer protein TrbD [Photobacterium damselae]TFZ62411.1 conjugal transfer protein TrbD [Photobacterium damselae subsp. piscicida]